MSEAARDERATPAGAGPTLVAAAMPEELAPLIDRLAGKRRGRVGACRVVEGRLGGTPLVVARTGDGRESAAAGARALIDRYRPSRLIVVGVAGALSRGVAAGRLVVAEAVRDGEGAAGAPDGDWTRRAVERLDALPGVVLSVPRVLGRAVDKARAVHEAGIRGTAVVDLESAAFGRVATAAGIPWTVLRVVSDTADEDIPINLAACSDEGGRVVRARVAARLLARPGAAVGMWSLRRRVIAAAETLADAVVRLVGEQR